MVERENMTTSGEGMKGKEGKENVALGEANRNKDSNKSTLTSAEANGEEPAGQGGSAAGGGGGGGKDAAALEMVEGKGVLRERRDSIQERRKLRGLAGEEPRVLRLPVTRSESSPMLRLGRSSDSSPCSPKSEPPSNQPSPRSPALKVLSKVFNFKDRPSPSWSPRVQRRGDAAGGKATPTDPRKRSSLHLPPTEVSPPARHDHEAKWFPDSRSGSPRVVGGSPLSPRGSNSPRTPHSPLSPLSPTSPGSKMARLPFFKPTTPASPSSISPGDPNGAMEQMDGSGIIYRPHAYRRAGAARNHWRTKSDTFTQPPVRVEPVRKRSRDDSE